MCTKLFDAVFHLIITGKKHDNYILVNFSYFSATASLKKGNIFI